MKLLGVDKTRSLRRNSYRVNYNRPSRNKSSLAAIEQEPAVDILYGLSVDLSTQLGLQISRNAVRKAVTWLSTTQAQAALRSIAGRMSTKIAVEGVKLVAMNVSVLRASVAALKAAASGLSVVGAVILTASIASLVYDGMDPSGYGRMLDKEQVDHYVAYARATFKNRMLQSLPPGTRYPVEVTPENYEPTMLFMGNDDSARKYTELFLQKVAEYVEHLEVNSDGLPIDRETATSNANDRESLLIAYASSRPTVINPVRHFFEADEEPSDQRPSPKATALATGVALLLALL